MPVVVGAPRGRRWIHPRSNCFQASSAALRKDDKPFRDFVDHTFATYYKSGQTQKWYEEFLTGFGLDPKASPPVMKEMLGKS